MKLKEGAVKKKLGASLRWQRPAKGAPDPTFAAVARQRGLEIGGRPADDHVKLLNPAATHRSTGRIEMEMYPAVPNT